MTPDDLDQLEGAGVFSVARPDDEAATDTFDAALTDDLIAYDAELLAHEGPDALTSDHTLKLSQFKQRQSAERQAGIDDAEHNSDRAGFVLAAFRSQRGWSRDQLTDWLGIAPDDLARMVCERWPQAVRMDLTYQRAPISELARRYGAHPDRLLVTFERGDPQATATGSAGCRCG